MTDRLHIRSAWTLDRIALAQVAAVLPALAVALFERGDALVPALATALAVVYFWQALFAWTRRSLIGWDGVVAALVFAILAPGDAALPQAALALTFGVVIGEQIFGGRGRAFLNPAAAGLVFLYFSFPEIAAGSASAVLGAAALAGAVFLIVLGLAPWRVLVAAAVGLTVTAAAAGLELQPLFLTSGAFLAAVVFLGCDPVCSASTNVGRLICGLLIGFLAIVLGYGDGGAQNPPVVFAVFLAALFAPAVDHAAILLHAFRRGRRRG